MLIKLSIKKRIYSGLVLLCSLVIITFFSAIKFSSDFLEETILDSIVNDEVNNIEKNNQEGKLVLPKSSHIFGFLASQGTVPNNFIKYGIGEYHDILWHNDRFHLFVKPFVHNGYKDTLYLAIQINSIERYEETLNIVLIAAAVSLLFAGLWASYWLTSFISYPISELSRQVRELDENDESLPQTLSDTDLAPIEDAINRYLKSIHEQIRKEKAFSGIASHELRTPISTIRSSLETFIDNADISNIDEKQMNRIMRAERAVVEMQYIAESLLQLIKQDNAEAYQTQSYKLRPLINELIEEHQILLRNPSIKIVVDEKEQTISSIKKELMKIIIGNILRNSLENTLDGEIRITLTGHSVSISDTGVGLPEDIIQWIKNQSNEMAHQKHLGIGLFLVTTLSKQLKLKLEISSSQQTEHGTRFELSWN